MSLNPNEMAQVYSILNDMHDNFAKAQAANFSPVPDGIYNVTMLEALIQPNNADPTSLTMRWKMQISEGEYKDRYLWHRRNFKNDEQSLGFLKGDLTSVGVELFDLGQLLQELGALTGKHFQVKATTSKVGQNQREFQNVSVIRVLDGTPEGSQASGAPAAFTGAPAPASAAPSVKPPVTPQAPAGATGNEGQLLQALHGLASSKGVQHDQLSQMAQSKYGVNSLTQLIEPQIRELAAELKALPEPAGAAFAL